MTMLLESFGSLLETPRPRQLRGDRAAGFFPAADVIADDEEIRLVMDVPGLKPNDLEVELSDGMLRVRGERPFPYDRIESEGEVQRLERGYGQFERALQVPRDVDPSAITASIEDGVLTLRVPLPEARRPHRIEVRSGDVQRVIDAEWSTDGGHQGGDEGHHDGEEERSGDRELAGAGS